jgi:peptidoglycan hydrolase-like protein with peptidoglycan-binding domain
MRPRDPSPSAPAPGSQPSADLTPEGGRPGGGSIYRPSPRTSSQIHPRDGSPTPIDYAASPRLDPADLDGSASGLWDFDLTGGAMARSGEPTGGAPVQRKAAPADPMAAIDAPRSMEETRSTIDEVDAAGGLDRGQLRRALQANPRFQRRLHFAPADFGVAEAGVDSATFAGAIARFQRDRGLTVDGIAGPRTCAAAGLDGAPAVAHDAPASSDAPDAPVDGSRIDSIDAPRQVESTRATIDEAEYTAARARDQRA